MKKTIAELLGLNIEASIQATEATITHVGKFTYFEKGTYGPYSFQDITLSDQQTSMVGVLASREEMGTDWQGRRISFLSGMNGRGQPSGVKTKYRERDKKWVLWITKDATLTAATDMTGAAAPQTAPPPQSAPRPAPAPAPAPQPHAAPAPAPQQRQQAQPQRQTQHPATDNPQACVDKCWDYLCRVGNFMTLALDQAWAIKESWDKKHPNDKMPIAELRAIAGGFCQGADRQQLPHMMPPDEDIDKYFK